MAKLEGVKVLDMVGGEITKVAYEGAEYVKVDGKAQIGDLILLNDKATVCVTSGAYYEGVSLDFEDDIEIIDDAGDEHAWSAEYYDAFRKVSVETTPGSTSIDERVDSLEKRVDALEEKPEPEAPKLKIGDYIVGNDASRYGITNDKMTLGKVVEEYTDGYDDIRVKVLRHATESEEVDVTFGVQSKYFRKATAEEIADYEESLKPKLKAGDWVKFTSYKGIVNREDISLNKAYQVFTDTVDELAFVDDAGDRRSQPLRAKEAYEIVAPPSVFEHIGRKEGEFKVGDIVRVITGEFTLFEPGTIGELVSGAHFIHPRKFGVKHGDTTQDCYDDFELIAPVESRVDRP